MNIKKLSNSSYLVDGIKFKIVKTNPSSRASLFDYPISVKNCKTKCSPSTCPKCPLNNIEILESLLDHSFCASALLLSYDRQEFFTKLLGN